jgi:organic radical activating enzyme
MENNVNSKVMEEVSTLTNQLYQAKGFCSYLSNMIDEGTYKLDAILNIVNNLKTREQNIIATGASPAVIQQLNAEQVDSLLEMLKSPAFQNIARQVLLKWVEK